MQLADIGPRGIVLALAGDGLACVGNLEASRSAAEIEAEKLERARMLNRERQRRWRKRNPEKRAAYMREWRRKRKEQADG